ncbi:hypothetical protein ACTHGU_00575 [Chitinophagaceae bacterium MMS25-I14]
MKPSGQSIERRLSWAGLLIFAAYSFAADVIADYFLPLQWKDISIAAVPVVWSIYIVQHKYWSAGFRKGMQFMRQSQWESAYGVFAAEYERFTQHRFIDKYRHWLLVSMSAYSIRAMSLRNMAFCQLMMKNKTQADFYYKNLLELPGGKELALPLLNYFE